MRYSPEGWTFDEVATQVERETEGQGTAVALIGEIVDGFDGNRTIQIGGVDMSMTESAQETFWDGRLGFPSSAAALMPTSIREQMAQYLVRVGGLGDKDAIIKTDNNVIESVLSDQYSNLDNREVIANLRGQLPPDSMVHRYSLHGRRLDLRVLSGEWTHDLSPIPGSDPAFGGLHITNDDGGGGAFMMKAVLTRMACFNSTVSDVAIFEHAHRGYSLEEFQHALTTGVGQVPMITAEMAEENMSWRNVPIEDADRAFQAIREQVGLSQGAVDRAVAYWEEQGSRHNLFEVVQAVTYGTHQITDEMDGRANPARRWDSRTRIEEQIVDVARHTVEHGEAALRECPVCHHEID